MLRERRKEPLMQTLLQDLRYGARALGRNKAFTAVVVLTLALGIGANTAIFSVVNAVLLESVPYKDPGKLVFVWTTMISQGVPISGSAAPDFREWRTRNQVFQDKAAYTYDKVNLSLPEEEPSRLQGAGVSPELFSLLGVNPVLGRTFLPEEDQWGRHRVVLLSYSLWQTRFTGEKNILSRHLRLGGQDYAIVGVMPKGMPFFDDLPRVDLWVPLAYAPKDGMNTRGNHYLNVIARLKPGVTIERATTEMAAIAKQIEQQLPENKGLSTKVVTVREQLVGDVRPALL